MSESELTREPVVSAPALRGTPLGTRVDSAHVRAGEVEPPAPAESAAPQRTLEFSVATTAQQLRSQAAQLATHLQRQIAAVDHREGELNARLAAMENQIRGARLWLSERHEELDRKKADLDARERDLVERENDLSNDAKSAIRLHTEPAPTGDAAYAERLAELARREAELERLTNRLGDQLADGEMSRDAKITLQALEARRDNLDRAEKMLNQEQNEFERQRKQLVEERAQLAEKAQADRRRMAEAEQRALGEQEKMRLDLKRQADELAGRQSALERLRAEVTHTQQETLEMRLATEELWARLCGTMAPAALTQSLAQIRLRLAEEQRLVRAELAGQKAEVQALSARLAEQHQKLAHERADWQAWSAQRQQELEKQAGLLAAQQSQIDDERADFAHKSAEWQNERFRLQQEIRKLLRHLNRPDSMAA